MSRTVRRKGLKVYAEKRAVRRYTASNSYYWPFEPQMTMKAALRYVRSEKYVVMNNPMDWNRMHTTRPNRRLAAVLAHDIVLGADPEVIWPLAKKPHLYYW